VDPSKYSWEQSEERPPPQPVDAFDPDARPRSVTVACVVAWVFSTIGLVAAGWMFLGITADRAAFERSLSESQDLEKVGLTAAQVTQTVALSAATMSVLGVLAIVAAIFAWRRSRVARVLLVLMSILTALIGVILSFAILPILWVFASLTTMSLLLAKSARRWYRQA
jgi:hypothetical protein